LKYAKHACKQASKQARRGGIEMFADEIRDLEMGSRQVEVTSRDGEMVR
jgi:hypothetical protein